MRLLHLILLPITILFIACGDDIDQEQGNNPNPNPAISTASGLRDGITTISDDSLGFVIYAPNKKSVYLIGKYLINIE